MKKPVSKRKHRNCRWVIPDGYLPELLKTDDVNKAYVSHECLCVLNPNRKKAQLRLKVFFENCDPAIIENIIVPAQRSLHIHMENLKVQNKPAIPRGLPYSILAESNTPVIIQMSRLDTTQSNMAFLSTMGYPLD